MYSNLKIAILVCCLALLSGCGSAKHVNSELTPPGSTLLSGQAKESLDYAINDQMTADYLMQVNEKTLSVEQRLEVIILREISKVSGKEKVSGVFDTLWNKAEIKDLLQSQDDPGGNLNALAELFFLLTADNESSWKNERAEMVYQKRLSRVNPDQLHGYGLHFYTLALLQSARINEAMPFLDRLNGKATDQVRRENLVVALNFTLKNKDHNNLARIMVQICRNYATDHKGFPDQQMTMALSLLESDSEFGERREELIAELDQSLHQTTFAKILLTTRQNTNQPAFSDTLSTAWKPAVVSGTPGNDVQKLPALTKGVGNDVVLVRVQVIRAGFNNNAIDPVLKDIASGLLQSFNFTSLHLVKESPIFLAEMESGEIGLPTGHRLQITPQLIDKKRCVLNVKVVQDGIVTFNTKIESVHGGVAILGGPRLGNDTLLLRISPLLGEMDKV